MRKLRKMLAIAMVVMFVCITFGAKSSYAYREGIEIGTDGNKLTFPLYAYNGEIKMIISESYGEHVLEYQIWEVQEDFVSKANAMTKKYSDELDKIMKEHDDIVDQFNAKNEEYKKETDDEKKEKLGEELEALQEKAKQKEEEYDKKVEEGTKAVRECIPDFKDGEWKKATNDTIRIDNANYTGEKKWIVWVKLTDANKEEHYNVTMYAVKGAKKASLNIEKTETTITSGDSETLKYTVSSGAGVTISWKSNNEKVATVDSNGKVTAVGEGTATITAELSDGSAKDSCKVTVKAKGANDGVEAGSAQDGSMANKPHANTGVSNAMIFVIAGVAIVAIVLGKKYKNTKIK